MEVPVESEKIDIQDVQVDMISGFIEAKVVYVSDVHKTNPGNQNFRFFHRVFLKDATGDIVALVKSLTDQGDQIKSLEGKSFIIPIGGCVHLYNSRFSVGEHVNEAELWYFMEDVFESWTQLEEDLDLPSTIPFHFLNYEQLGELQVDSPFDVMGSVAQSEYLEEYRPPATEIQLQIQGGTIFLGVWDNYAEVLNQGGENGLPLRVAIKGVRKLDNNVNLNSHVGNTANIFIIDYEIAGRIFDDAAMELYQQTFAHIP